MNLTFTTFQSFEKTGYTQDLMKLEQGVIGHFQKYHYTLCLSSKILHKHCFHFLLGLTQKKLSEEETKGIIMVFLKVVYDLELLAGFPSALENFFFFA